MRGDAFLAGPVPARGRTTDEALLPSTKGGGGEPMLVEDILQNLEHLARELLETPASARPDRWGAFTPGIRVLRRFNNRACGADGYIEEKIAQFEWHVKAIAGLSPTNNHSAEEHFVGARGAIDSLRMAFGDKVKEPVDIATQEE
jgi:hypothetical protein